VFDQCIQYNVLTEPLPPSEAILLHRLDTEFKDHQLDLIFKKIAQAGIKYVFFIPTQYLKPKALAVESLIWLKALSRLKTPTFCGYIRTKGHFERLYEPYFDLKLDEVTAGQPLQLLTLKNS
jgi:hypothetical protein